MNLKIEIIGALQWEFNMTYSVPLKYLLGISVICTNLCSMEVRHGIRFLYFGQSRWTFYWLDKCSMIMLVVSSVCVIPLRMSSQLYRKVVICT